MGKLFVIEGLDGSGKTTQLERLCARLAAQGNAFRQIKLPDYEDPSSTLVKMYLNGAFGTDAQSVNAYAASSFYAVDRFASFQRHWQSDFHSGKIILADRYATSNAIHQMVKLPREEWDAYLEWMENFEYRKLAIPKPDCVIYLDVPVEISQRLLSERYHGEESKKDVHESNVGYLINCREAALYAAERLGWHRINCTQDGLLCPIDQIGAQIDAIVSKEILLHA